MTKQIHLAAHFPGVNNTTVWSDPRSGSHIEFSSFAHLARTAERAKLDFLFLAEGLRLREQNGQIYDLDVVGRPDTFTVLAALAAVTDRLGLAGTINSTFNEPYEVARQFASLDHLSGGRAAWNVVTSWDAFTGENFRRGGFLPQAARYERARTFLRTTWELFDSWHGDEIIADKASGVFLTRAKPGTFEHRDAHFDISGQFNVPRGPQGRPVIFQAGDSEEGREFAASSADAIFSRHGTLAEGQAFYADVKARLAKYGRTPDQLLILPAATFVLGDTDAEAAELARDVRRQQVSGPTAIAFLEQLWNRDLSGYDPDGPLPDIDPDLGEHTIARGRASVRMYRDPLATAAQWRANPASLQVPLAERRSAMPETLTATTHVSVTRLAGHIGAEISGVDSGAPLSDEVIARIRRALLDHKVVFLRGQSLNYRRQVAFAERLGPLTLGHPTLASPPGQPLLEEIDSLKGGKANYWHTDVTFVDRPPAFTLLHAVVIPPAGGDTIWANTVFAYQGLPPELRELADRLRVVHTNDFDYARTFNRGERVDPALAAAHEEFISTVYETEHPPVRVHPETSERSLLLGGFARTVLGFTAQASRDLIRLLQDYITRPEYTVRWRWRQDDLAIWDNRTTQHYAIADYGTAHRRGERVTVAGPVPVGVDGRPSVAVRGDASAYYIGGTDH